MKYLFMFLYFIATEFLFFIITAKICGKLCNYNCDNCKNWACTRGKQKGCYPVIDYTRWCKGK